MSRSSNRSKNRSRSRTKKFGAKSIQNSPLRAAPEKRKSCFLGHIDQLNFPNVSKHTLLVTLCLFERFSLFYDWKFVFIYWRCNAWWITPAACFQIGVIGDGRGQEEEDQGRTQSDNLQNYLYVVTCKSCKSLNVLNWHRTK